MGFCKKVLLKKEISKHFQNYKCSKTIIAENSCPTALHASRARVILLLRGHELSNKGKEKPSRVPGKAHGQGTAETHLSLRAGRTRRTFSYHRGGRKTLLNKKWVFSQQ